jgi:hypothetical protein
VNKKEERGFSALVVTSSRSQGRVLKSMPIASYKLEYVFVWAVGFGVVWEMGVGMFVKYS